MGKRLIWGFPSLEVAEAFTDGMRHVNDSAIEDVEVVAEYTSWTVRYEDNDSDEDAEYQYVRNNMGG